MNDRFSRTREDCRLVFVVVVMIAIASKGSENQGPKKGRDEEANKRSKGSLNQ